VVKPGDRLRVRVLEVDLERRRISLTARSDQSAPKPAREDIPRPRRFTNNPFAELLKKR
ncbi:MAG: S1 RNA-binding domain-containing protein, partial [Deltaproteobacteria bacterium]|nr:S1 RNA-binding domain-containing protein [Deltaproteobacteria bacterium]